VTSLNAIKTGEGAAQKEKGSVIKEKEVGANASNKKGDSKSREAIKKAEK